MNGGFASLIGLVMMAVTGYIWYRRKLLLREGLRHQFDHPDLRFQVGVIN